MLIKLYHIILGIALFLSLPTWSNNNRVQQDSTALSQQKEVFVKASVSKSTVYIGEAFTVTYALYTATAIIDPQKETTVKFEHCFQEQYPLTTTARAEKIGGIQYNIKILQQYLVIANVSGRLQIPSLKKVIQRSVVDANDFFGQEKLVMQTVVSAPQSVMVKPLPLSAGHDVFCNAVGNFKIKGGYHAVAKTSNLLKFNVTIEGMGNTKNCVFTPPGSNGLWEVYNANIDRQDTLEVKGLKTKVEYTFELATNYKGNYTIPDFAFTVFNPNTNSYQKFTTGSYRWEVTQGILPKTVPKSNKKSSEDQEKQHSGNLYSYSILFYAIVGLGFLLLLYAFFETWILKRWNFFKHYYMHRKALRIALSACKQQLKMIDALSKDAFFQNTTSILLRYIQQIKGEDFVRVLVRSNFKKTAAYWPIEIQNELESWWHRTAQNRFGNSTPIYNPKEHLSQLEIILRTLDRHEPT